MSARRVIRFVLDGQPAVTLTAPLPRSASVHSASLPANKGKAASRKRTGRPSLPSTDVDGDTVMAADTPQPHTATAASSPTASVSSAASSPPLLAATEWSRPTPSQPDVIAVRADLANIALPSNQLTSSTASSHSSSSSQPPPALHPSSLSLVQPAASSASSAVAPLSSQLLGSMLNVSEAQSVSPPASSVDVSQWPYSGAQLGRARVKSAFPAIIPSSARWFDPTGIAAIERRMFPDWLTGAVGRYAAAAQQRSDWYQQIRNEIVAAYRANPRIFLTVTACRRYIAADVGTIARIHTFLQQCGLINYHVDPGSQPLMGYNSREKLSYPVLLHNTHSSGTAVTSCVHFTLAGCHCHAVLFSPHLCLRRVCLPFSASASAVSDSALSQLYSFPSAKSSTVSSATVPAAFSPAASEQPSDATATAAAASTPSSTTPSAALPPSFRRALVGPLVSQELLADSARYRLPVGSSPACSSCGSDAALEGVRFVCRQEPSVVLCSDCFGRGRFPQLLVADDFLRDTAATSAAYSHISPAAAAPMPSSIAFGAASAATTINTSQPVLTAASASSAAGAGEWKPEETLRLLDALSQHGEDWDAVADTVGTKSKDECCMHFLALPIEDPFLDHFATAAPAATQSTAAHTATAATTAATTSTTASPPRSPLPAPFADTGNPILAQVAFLASTVSPAVAAAAAQAAIRYYTHSSDGSTEAVNGQHEHIQPNQHTMDTSADLDYRVDAPPTTSAVEATSTHGHTVDDAASNGNTTRSVSQSAAHSHATPVPAPSQRASAISTAAAPAPLSSVSSVSALCLSAAAVKAHELCLDEERKLLRAVAQLVHTQMRRVEVKINHMQELDAYINARRQDVHRLYQTTIRQHVSVQQQQQQHQQVEQNGATAST